MVNKTLAVILIPFLLASCVSISAGNVPVHQQVIITATLKATVTKQITVTSTTPPATQTPIPVSPTQQNCTNAAVLLRDVTIPDGTRMKTGERFTKTWELKNTGTCSWMGYTMEFAKGDGMNAPASVPIPDTNPNEKVQISVDLTAPAADGMYTASFTLNDPGGKVIPIGLESSFWVKIVVGNFVAQNPMPVLNPTSIHTPSNMGADCVYSQNAGYISQIISLINQARADANIPALTFNAEISTFSQNHSDDMALNNLLSHDGSTETFGQRMAGFSQAHSVGVYGEILAIGAPQDAISQWQKDEHWDFVLNTGFTLIGAGYAYNSCSMYGGYFTVDFGS